MLRSFFISSLVFLLLFCFGQKSAGANRLSTCTNFTVTETVQYPGSSNTLSPCTDYEIIYTLTNSSVSNIDDYVTINLPMGITYVDFGGYSGASVAYQSGTTSPVFYVSGWSVTSSATFTITVHTPAVCSTPLTGITTVTGTTLCPVSMNSLHINVPVLYALNAFGPGTQYMNNGDVTELVIRLENASADNSGIPEIDLNFTAMDPSVSFSLFNYYYLSTSSTAVSGNTYTYTHPMAASGVVSVTHTFTGSSITLPGTYFSEFNTGNPALEQGQVVYVHIPFKAVCGNSTPPGNCEVSWGCTGTPCTSINVPFDINVLSGYPHMEVTGYPNIVNGSYCSSSPGGTSTISFLYANTGAPVGAPAPAGGSRASNIVLRAYAPVSFGSLNLSNIQLSYGLNPPITLSVPITTGTLYFGTDLYQSYEIHLSDLLVSGTNWSPLGTGNTLADLDGDGRVDDLAEGGSFRITAEFNYNTASCPGFGACGTPRKTLPYIIANYTNQCDPNPPALPAPTGYGDGVYFYEAIGGSASVNAPPDVVEGFPFTIDLCTKPYYERWAPVGFDFDCPNGYHQIRLNLPLGYHLNPGGLIPLGGGVYQLNHSITAATYGCTGLPVSITPELQEFCGSGPTDPSYVLITFGGRLPLANCSGAYSETYMLNCIDNIPLLLDCPGTGGLCPTIPANFGVDNISFDLEYVCDQNCATCVSGITCGNTSTYHHCSGNCDSYFGTDTGSFSFLRSTLGTLNAGYVTDCTPPGALTTVSGATIDLAAAYPGDEIEAKLQGFFQPDPATLPAHIGTDFQDIQMQIRYDALPSGTCATYDIFDLASGEVVITNPVTTLTYTSTVTYTAVLNAGVVEMNFKLDAGAHAWMYDPAIQYTLNASVFLKVKATPALAGYTTFFAGNSAYPLTQLRAEFMGLLTNTAPAPPDTILSCDSWGTHFKILQPREAVAYYPGYGFNQTSGCDPYPVQFIFQSASARYNSLTDDFPVEFRPYAALDPHVEITIPPGYTLISSAFNVPQSNATLGGINNFSSTPTMQSYPILLSDIGMSTTASGTTLSYNGISGTGTCWPALDDKYYGFYPYCSISMMLQADCDAPASSHFRFKGRYTEGVQQSDPAYQVHTDFDLFSVLPVYHVNPTVLVPSLGTATDAYSNEVSFTFNLCNTGTVNANHPWLAIENFPSDVLDLSSAQLVQILPAPTTTLTPTIYTDPYGHTALIFNLGALASGSGCMKFVLTAHVNSNGCIPTGNPPQLESLNIIYGNECSGSTVNSPDPLCVQDTTVFQFQRYPSNLEMTMTNTPPDSVDLCDGLLHYEFEIKSSDLGTITDPAFWMHLPAGISLVDISFTYPSNSLIPPIVLTAPDGTTAGGDPLWNIPLHVSLPNGNQLPGTLSGSFNNTVKVVLTLQTSCTYNATDYIDFYAGGISSCSEQLITPILQHRPAISDAVPFDDLSVQVTMSTSDSDPGLNCNNVATFTVTVTNNGTASNQHNETLTVTIPGAPLTVSNPGTFTPSGSTLTMPFAVDDLPGLTTYTFTFEMVLGNNVYCQTHLPVAAVIGFSETVDCTESGGSCNMTYSSEPDSLFIDACCPCTVDLGPNQSICEGESFDLNVSTPGTYSWAPATGLSCTTCANPTATPASTTTYTVTVTTTEGFCTDMITITVNPLPVVTVNSATVCAGQSAILTASGAVTYTWNPSGTLSSSTGTPVTATPSTTTVYTVTGTDSNGCNGSATSTVTVNPLPVLTIGSNSPVCVGATLNLSSSGGGTYAWSGPGGFTSLSQNPSITGVTLAASGTYTVTVTDANGCVNSATTSVVVNPLPTVTIGSNSPVCVGSTLNLTSSGGGTYAWSGPGGFTSSSQNPSIPGVTSTAAGTYTVTVTSASGCVASATTAVVVNPLPTLTVTTDTDSICKGVSAHLHVSGASTYTWTPATGLNCTNCTDPAASPASTITYTVTGTDANGCVGSATMLITVFTPTVSITPLTSSICVGDNVTLNAFGSLVTNYEWYSTPPLAFITTGSSLMVPGISAGIFQYQVWGYTNIPGCKAVKTATVTVHDLPAISATPSATICPGVTASLSAFGASSYSWAPPTGLSCTTCSTTNANPPSDITYTVTGTDAFGCHNTATSFVHVIPTPTITVSPALSYTICPGGPLTFTASGTGITSYNWYNTTTSPYVYMGSSASLTVTPTVNSTYLVQGSVSEGCVAWATVTVYITLPPTISGCHNINCGESITLTASGTGPFTWSPVAGSGATMTDYPAATTTYTVMGNCGLTSTCTVNVNAVGATTWPKHADAGSTGVNEITDVIQNSMGDVFVIGNFSGTLNLGTFTLSSSGSLSTVSTFIVKYSDCGVEWAKQLSSYIGHTTIQSTYGRGITLDNDGNVIVTGSFYGSMDLFPISVSYPVSISSGSRRNAYIIRLNGNTGGSMHAVQSNGASAGLTTTYWAEGTGISCKNDFVYVSGFVNDDIKFASLPNLSIVDGNQDIFVVKLNAPNLSTPAVPPSNVWLRKFGNASTANPDGPETEVSVDNSDNVYVGASIYSQINFGVSPPAGAGGTFMQGFVGRYTNLGVEDVGFAFGNTTNHTRLNDLVTDGSGNTYVTGSWQGNIQGPSGSIIASSYDRDVYMARLHKSSGTSFSIDWLKRAIGFGTDDGRGVALDNSGNVYFTGRITTPWAFEGMTGPSGNSSGGEVYVCQRIASTGAGGTYFNISKTSPSSLSNLTVGNSISANGSGSQVVFGGSYTVPAAPTGTVLFNSPSITTTAPNAPAFFAARTNTSGTFYRLAGTSDEDEPKVTDEGPLQLFPNPNNGAFMLQFRDHALSKARIEVYDGQGKKVLAEIKPVSDDQVELNLKEIAEGVYMVMIWQDGEIYSKRVVIMK